MSEVITIRIEMANGRPSLSSEGAALMYGLSLEEAARKGERAPAVFYLGNGEVLQNEVIRKVLAQMDPPIRPFKIKENSSRLQYGRYEGQVIEAMARDRGLSVRYEFGDDISEDVRDRYIGSES